MTAKHQRAPIAVIPVIFSFYTVSNCSWTFKQPSWHPNNGPSLNKQAVISLYNVYLVVDENSGWKVSFFNMKVNT